MNFEFKNLKIPEKRGVPFSEEPSVLFALEVKFCDSDFEESLKNAEKSCADLICVKFNFCDENFDLAQATKFAQEYAKKSVKPLILKGSDDSEIDEILLPELAKSVKTPVIIAQAEERNYEKIIAETAKSAHCAVLKSPIDINCAKELNILSENAGQSRARILMNTDTGALGYGLDYGFSMVEKALQEGLKGDDAINIAKILFIGEENDKTKEVKTAVAKGDTEQAAMYEIAAAGALIAAGVDVLVCSYAETIQTFKRCLAGKIENATPLYTGEKTEKPKEMTGLRIFKYLPAAKKLPETNCKKCGYSTCMTFAVKLAKNPSEQGKCPNLTEEFKEIFEKSKKNIQNEVVFSDGLKIGGETVFFRHEKTFLNPTVFAVEIASDDEKFDEKLDKIADFGFEHAGKTFKIDAVKIIDRGNCVLQAEKAAAKGFGLIVKTSDVETINILSKFNPIFETTPENFEIANIATVFGSTADELERASTDCEKTSKVLYLKGKDVKNTVFELINIRKKIFEDKSKGLSYPVIADIDGANAFEQCAFAAFCISKCLSAAVFKDFNPDAANALFMLRENIFTDPQKPMQVEAKVYEINDPDENSPIIVTVNFALSYFSVLNETGDYPCYLAVLPTDGMSVLTAWSADKLTPENTAKMILSDERTAKNRKKTIILPGLLASCAEEIQARLPEFRVLTGPKEAYKLKDFLKSL